MPTSPRIIRLASVVLLLTGCTGSIGSSSSDDDFKSDDGAGGGSSSSESSLHCRHKPCHGTTSSSQASSTAGAGAGTSSSTGASTSASTGSGAGSPGGLFSAPEPWSTSVASDAVDAHSAAIIAALADAGGWGTGVMKTDFSITLQHADASTPFQTFTTTDDFYAPDCDHVPFPVPAGGAVEGEDGYRCTQDGDCHLLVVDDAHAKLYEMWRAFTGSSGFKGGCTAVWDLAKAYPANLRGDGCTSADAGGFPIASMLFTADEIAAGDIPHAIRFILPNARIRGGGVYVHPGTHTTGATSGGSDAPPYGVRLRLRASFDASSLSPSARVVVKAMQTYGMFLADGGNIALTAADDRFTAHKWSEVGFDSQSLKTLAVTDFEVVEMGTPVQSGDCARNP